MGTGGAPEGVIARGRAALPGRRHPGPPAARATQGEADRARAMGIKDVNAKLTLEELARGDVLFAGTGVTEGDFLKGVRFRAARARSRTPS